MQWIGFQKFFKIMKIHAVVGKFSKFSTQLFGISSSKIFFSELKYILVYMYFEWKCVGKMSTQKRKMNNQQFPKCHHRKILVSDTNLTLGLWNSDPTKGFDFKFSYTCNIDKVLFLQYRCLRGPTSPPNVFPDTNIYVPTPQRATVGVFTQVYL